MRILLIDDTELNVSLLQHLIKKIPEYEAIAFTNPGEALDWCIDNEPDMVVVDYIMPEMNGIQFTQQFRGFVDYADIPVLMIVQASETTVRQNALAAGVTDFLNKPLDNSEFVVRARNMLTLRQSQKRLNDHHTWLNEEINKATAKISAQEQETIFLLTQAIEYREPHTHAHIQRIANYAKLIASGLGLTLQEQDLIFKAAPMHDVGKIGIINSVLLKLGKLITQEFNLVKQHTIIGHKLLSNGNSPLLQLAAEIAYTHHEKFDGSGYPRGLSGENIPLSGRIVAVADVFDVLTSARPHKHAWSVNEACVYLKKNAGSHFDPACVDAFFRHFNDILAIKKRYPDDHVNG
ncbi:MAG: two-component system response regulator [Betaproteobacteria bacterium HGW-Betaproteobacteria-22]|nr:MAG: two-component system response regulator [Betaproteobacteria bacterium HGW-Betaproteobacteria-22]